MSDFWKDKKVLITGANGFLGSHLSLKLAEYGSSILGIIKEYLEKSFLNICSDREYFSKIKVIRQDIIRSEAINEIFEKYKPDICFHIAAQAIVGMANKSPIPTFETNIEGTWNILNIACNFGTKAVIVASSDKAYGEHVRLPYKESFSLNALHPYDASKSCADILTRVYAHTYGLNTAVTRCANIYGPGDFNFSRIIPDTIRSVVFDKNPVIRSDGTPLRDYIYIDDVVEGYIKLAEKLYNNRIELGEAFNFGTGKPIDVLSLVNKIIDISKKNLRPDILSRGKIKGEIDKQYLCSKKANKLLGWRNTYDITSGLRETYLWYKTYLLSQS